MKDSSKLMKMRNTWAEIDLDCIAHNISEARRIIPRSTRIAAVLKANAYGHGAVQVAKTLIENKVDYIAVACLTEALELRRHYKEIPVLIMGYTPDEHLSIAVENNITMTVFSLEQAWKISSIARALKVNAIIHVKIDTGLNRLGFKPGCDAVTDIIKIAGLKNINIEGIFTHLVYETEKMDRGQFAIFADMVDKLEEQGINIPIKHICDSIGTVRYPEYDLDMVRLGAFIYGVSAPARFEGIISLKPALAFKSQIARIVEVEKGESVGYACSFVAGDRCRIGTVTVGYVDGLNRNLSNKGEVIVRGRRAPIAGLICMDQCMIDLTHIPDAEAGDEVILISGAAGGIDVNEIAAAADGNRNEVMSAISRRVPRVYIQASCVVEVVDYILELGWE